MGGMADCRGIRDSRKRIQRRLDKGLIAALAPGSDRGYWINVCNLKAWTCCSLVGKAYWGKIYFTS